MYMDGNIMTGMIDMIDAYIGLRDSFLAAAPAISQTAGTVLVTAIWQGAVVATCLTICLKLTDRISAALRFGVWTAGFVAVVGLPFLPLLFHFAARFVSGSDASLSFGLTTGAPKPWLQLDIRWSIAITLLWGAASLFRMVDLAVHSVRLRRLWKTASPVEHSAAQVCALATDQLWGRKRIEICTTNALDRPSVIGFLAPRILIPEWLFDQLTPGELDQIVLHESEHLRRGDDWTNLLQKLSLVLFPLNPVLLWMERQLCLEREMACDEGVIRVTHAPRAYAACLASLAERGMQHRSAAALGALSLGAWHRRPELVRRVHSVLLRRPALGPLGSRSLLAILGCGLVFGSVELSRCPQLVAFRPATATETAHVHIPAARDFTQPRMLNASYTAPAPYLTQLKASMPVRQARSLAVHTRRPAQPRPALRQSAEPVAQELALSTMQPEADSTQAQGWVVLTTWEQVDSLNQSNPSNEEPAENATAQPAGQLTVTRLIFRILPASSVSKSPAMLPVRSSWFVIQL
jgi:beta-lactamase regulating signal transducer with metallopeptidase domain